MPSEFNSALEKAIQSDIWVIKVGSAMLTNHGKAIDIEAIDDWAKQIKAIRNQGKKVILVSSGAIATGLIKLNWQQKPTDLPRQQAAAAVGQMTLTHHYEQIFANYGIQTAQVLLTHDDASDRKRYLNVRATLDALLKYDFLPVINENDTVSYEEIKFGDNDNLGAMVANLISAGLYIILTDQNGLYDKDPRKNPDANIIHYALANDDALYGYIGESKSTLGSGGMLTKIQAARKATHSGTSTIITHGRRALCIESLLSKQLTGTFLYADKKVNAKRQWISAQLKTKGTLVIDEGAEDAIIRQGKSLLAVGIKSVSGNFIRGEIISIVNKNNLQIAKGISNYSSEECNILCGSPSYQFSEILGYTLENQIIHRDNLILI